MRNLGSEDFSWSDLFVIIENVRPDGSSAMFRARHPRSWWWDSSIDFQAAILHSSALANWQRGGGKGGQPKMAKRPSERPRAAAGKSYAPSGPEDLAARRAKLRSDGGMLKAPKSLKE